MDKRNERLPAQEYRNKDLVFHAISWHAQDVKFDEGEPDEEDKYTIKVFGVDKQGHSVSLTVTDFTPFFYIKVPETWTDTHVAKLQSWLESQRGLHKINKSMKPMKLLKKKDFWGFTNNMEFKFARLCFTNYAALKRVMWHLAKPVTVNSLGLANHKFVQYESNIEPFLRFIHLMNLQPTGWIKVAAGTFRSTETLPTTCQIDVETNWRRVQPFQCDDAARFLVASFDLECMSDTGDFPVAKDKKYKKVAADIYEAYNNVIVKKFPESQHQDVVHACLLKPFGLDPAEVRQPFQYALERMHKVFPKDPDDINSNSIRRAIKQMALDDILTLLAGRMANKKKREEIVEEINKILSNPNLDLPEVRGDAIIQIGTTFHYYGDRECCERVIITSGTCADIPGARVIACETEADLMIKWKDLMQMTNPDVITGYNIFGFDFSYMYDRATDLGIANSFMKLGRFEEQSSKFEKKMLSSSALGDNELKYIDMQGRVLIDMMKVIQRDHKLDSYKLDAVATHFMKMNKNDVSPQDIFRLQKGTDEDRKIIAEYCIQDCALCNHLMMKLEILANNMGMSNVCLVPLSYIFMRGQGIKIFSLVLKQCKDENFVIPVKRPPRDEANDVVPDDGYEGAIVLEPKTGIYINEPIAVLDYASLYPSSMISENLSHDMIVLKPEFDNLPNTEYLDISYDIYEGIGDKKKKVGERKCRYAQPANSEKGIIPRILMKLLAARKSTRKKAEWSLVTLKDGRQLRASSVNSAGDTTTIRVADGLDAGKDVVFPSADMERVEDCFNDFQKAVLDGMQLAYKVTANSLYGQVGARTSPIYLKDLAACTTATGRKMITSAKAFIEANYDGSEVVYGDTDSLFLRFKTVDEMGNKLTGTDALRKSRELGIDASRSFKKLIKAPHDLEYEKIFDPFILLSKKRYVGNKYEMDDHKFKQASMGIVLKRRDNAQIVKKIYGGAIDIILNQKDIMASINFVRDELEKLINGETPLDELIITKSLKANYADPTKIAHKVLAERIGERDPGNRPQVNDRIPYAYVSQPPPDPNIPKSKQPKVLQGERIEHPSYIKENGLKPDFGFYITNQIMKPILQLYAIVADHLGIRSREEYQEIHQALVAEHGESKGKDKLETMKEADVKRFLFDPFLERITPPKPLKPVKVPRVTAAAKKAAAAAALEATEPPKTDGDAAVPPKRRVVRKPKAVADSPPDTPQDPKVVDDTPKAPRRRVIRLPMDEPNVFEQIDAQPRQDHQLTQDLADEIIKKAPTRRRIVKPRAVPVPLTPTS